MENKVKFAYDAMSSLGIMNRDGSKMTIEQIFDYYMQSGILLYNSQRGDAPMILEGEIIIKDVNEEIKDTDGKS